MQFVVLLIPYASIVSKSKSTGVNIVQLSYPPSSLTGMVRLSCFSYVKLGLMAIIQSVLQWYGKFCPVKTERKVSTPIEMFKISSNTVNRFWKNPNPPISLRICSKLFIMIPDEALSVCERVMAGRKKIRVANQVQTKQQVSYSSSTYQHSTET